MKKNKQIKPEWFNGELYSSGDTVKNPFSGEEYELTAEELSMYDFIKGVEIVMSFGGGYMNSKIHDDFHKAIRWFMKANPKAYMVLLD